MMTEDKLNHAPPESWITFQRSNETGSNYWRIRVEGDPGITGLDFAAGYMGEERAHLMAAAPRLAAALQLLYDETADYIRINNLGDVHHSQAMEQARDALALL